MGEAVRIDETIDAIELYYAQGWTDGLPVVPPTRAKVQAMVERSGRAASEVLAELPPQGGKATVERIATNAVMAGCLPEYMPVILTALEAMLETRFNLRGVLCSNHVSKPLLILNGPIVQALHEGWADARAVLWHRTIGGSPGAREHRAQPGYWTRQRYPGSIYCIAENDASPWSHCTWSADFNADVRHSVPIEAPHINNHGSQNARDPFTVVADCVHPRQSHKIGRRVFRVLAGACRHDCCFGVAQAGRPRLSLRARPPARALVAGGWYVWYRDAPESLAALG
jgi:hypothetical protein